MKSDLPDISYFKYTNFGSSIAINTTNYKQFPDRGTSRSLSFSLINGYEKYNPGTTAPVSATSDNVNHSWFTLKFQMNRIIG